MEDLRKLIGKNLTELRKRKGLTQIKLAEMFNYTDRAVSKWESGETLPDIEVLYNLCEFYGVTLDYLVHEDNEKYVKRNVDGLQKSNKIAISVLVTSIVWMIATIVFVYSLLSSKYSPLWQSFVWAVPATCVMVVLFNRFYFNNKLVYFIAWSLFVWSALAATYLSYLEGNIWPIFLIGVPAQFSLVVWLNIKKIKKLNKEEIE